MLDQTKAPAAAITMVRGDGFFLRRWVDYYGSLFGRQHLYVMSHGNAPEVRAIAEGCNVVNIPFDPTREKFDRRRWEMLSFFTCGLLRYHNWVVCGDVDELVVPDPAVAPDLMQFLARFPADRTPAVLCPLGLEIIHNPELEPGPLEDGLPILSRRRLFRLNANYSKPCITRQPLTFSPGGHSCSINRRRVEPDLYLLHLRFVSHEVTLARLRERQEMRAAELAGREDGGRGGRSIWERDAETYLKLSKQAPVAETVEFPEFRRKMMEERREVKPGGHWFFGGGRTKDLYRLPERFAALV